MVDKRLECRRVVGVPVADEMRLVLRLEDFLAVQVSSPSP